MNKSQLLPRSSSWSLQLSLLLPSHNTRSNSAMDSLPGFLNYFEKIFKLAKFTELTRSTVSHAQFIHINCLVSRGMTHLIIATLQSFVPMWYYKHQDSCRGPIPPPAGMHMLTVQQWHCTELIKPSPATDKTILTSESTLRALLLQKLSFAWGSLLFRVFSNVIRKLMHIHTTSLAIKV